VLAAPVTSAIDQPAWDNSAMDGYAVNAADAAAHGGRLRVAQRIPAGSSGEPLASGTAARIFTGAPVPENADTVVVQEVCTADGDLVQLPAELEPGANIRRRGEDVRAGDRLIEPGTRLRPQHLALAASVGAAELTVTRRLRVAFFASGDELVMPGRPLGPGQIYNSNRFLFAALLQALGCEVIDLGIVEDRLEATVEALADGAARADLVMASGGVSVGDEDHVRPAVQRLGSLDLWRVSMRPGRPLAFGHIGATPFIGSPGNPVSLFVTFCLFARPFILRMQGVTGELTPQRLPVAAGFDWPKGVKRREYQRARLEPDADGRPVAKVFASRSSAALTSLTWANGLVVLDEGRTLQAGETVPFIPFSELLD
jgi:molybdopterin molybdotransferase